MSRRVHLHAFADRLYEGLEALAGRVPLKPHARRGEGELETLDRHLCPIVADKKVSARGAGHLNGRKRRCMGSNSPTRAAFCQISCILL